MKATSVVLAALLAVPTSTGSLAARQRGSADRPRESRIPTGTTSLYARDIGRGQPFLVLHGGPDFDHGYLLPDLDRLADAFRLIYYDQRGRGRSADGVRAEDVTLRSDVEDVDRVREYFQLASTGLLGHSWGTVVALEYALRHPDRVSHLILMNPAPASVSDAADLRRYYLEKIGAAEMSRQRALVQSAAYQQGDPEAVAARYRIHFKPALKRAEHYEKLMATMKSGFVAQGKQGIVKARAVEDRLMHDTWELTGYDLMPKLATLSMPTLVIWGDYDFIPVSIPTHIAQAIRGSRLVTLKDCGHFAYLECPSEVRAAVDEFLQGMPRK